jgi:hypothetical protein
MRTRIALVAIVPIAVITVSLLSQLVSVQPARAAVTSPHRPAAPSAGARTDRLTSFVTPGSTRPAATLSILPALDLAAVLVAGRSAGTEVVAPAPAPAPVPVDTVTPDQRAAWERVAMCEEGGNWQADGPRFSGGLGITRANWAAYGGLQYAPSGALATPDQQIMVAQRIQGTVPDQYGCRGW